MLLNLALVRSVEIELERKFSDGRSANDGRRYDKAPNIRPLADVE